MTGSGGQGFKRGKRVQGVVAVLAANGGVVVELPADGRAAWVIE